MKKPSKIEAACFFPTPEHPYFHLKASFILGSREHYEITEIKVNGKRVRDYETYHDGLFVKDHAVKGGGLSSVAVRCDWKRNEDILVNFKGESKDKKEKLSFSLKTKTPYYNGYWDSAWRYYAGVVCTETAGISRDNEPVHLTLGLYTDRIADPEREIRIISVDPETGIQKEVPSQVYDVSRYECDKQSDRYQPTTVVEVFFYASVPAYSSKVYLAYYGNPKARRPVYKSNFEVCGKGLGLTLENEYYKTLLHEKSGAIDEIHMKMGANRIFAHHLETNGALHWNPGLYAPPRPWMHASDWDPPKNYSKLAGPLFVTTQRSGPMDQYPESNISINYKFYDRVPYILMSSSIEIKKELSVKALRNGEVVLNRELVEEFAWRDPDGYLGSMRVLEGPRHPKHAKVLPYDVPWVCFFNRKYQSGLGLININVTNFNNDGGLCRLFQPYSYLQWGPWIYYARPLVYTFASSNPGRLIPVPAGNVYYEEMAFLPVRFGMEKEHIQYLDDLYLKLTSPLYIKVIEDTDPRAPEGFMPPILLSEFEEMEDD
ncbi:MAG: hypothetical protein JSV25_04460 [Spirochaetota bacterium]|nr:MAG: hypothetical protein JSV25_04460 [Spirochaetota bacterium]